MNKQEEMTKTTRYCVQWDSHARHMCTVFCSLMEHQSLVDVAICCGTNTIHAHKCVLAANSPYFREQLEKNNSVEQIIVNGLDFAVVKSIIEFMYCGETNILNENLRYVVAAAKFFQMRGLQALVSDRNDVQNEASIIDIPPPLFISKKPKYTNALRQFNPPNPSNPYKLYKNPINDSFLYKKVKRKVIRTEAEKACAKEAAASRLALEALQKELANTPRINSFVIEDSCTETTVENFIPHAEEAAIFENLTNMPTIPIQMVNFSNVDGGAPVLSVTADSQHMEKQLHESNKNPFTDPFVNLSANSVTKLDDVSDKIKSILGNEINGNVEIMFRTSDGNFVGVTDDLIQNLSGGGTLQYQIIDENGQLGEVREIQIQGQQQGDEEGEKTENTTLSSIMEKEEVDVVGFDPSLLFKENDFADVSNTTQCPPPSHDDVLSSSSKKQRLEGPMDVIPFEEIFETDTNIPIHSLDEELKFDKMKKILTSKLKDI